jgi:hypothetical protein
MERMISEKDKEFTDVFSRFVNGKKVEKNNRGD